MEFLSSIWATHFADSNIALQNQRVQVHNKHKCLTHLIIADTREHETQTNQKGLLAVRLNMLSSTSQVLGKKHSDTHKLMDLPICVSGCTWQRSHGTNTASHTRESRQRSCTTGHAPPAWQRRRAPLLAFARSAPAHTAPAQSFKSTSRVNVPVGLPVGSSLRFCLCSV